MQLGYVGLGKMGMNMVRSFLDHQVEVVAWNRSPNPRQEAAEYGAQIVEELTDLAAKLTPPRTIWLMVPNGKPVDEVINVLAPTLSPNDLVIDGGNSFYRDSMRRAEELERQGLHFMDVGVSGGPSGALNGACLMVGGSQENFKKIEELLKVVASPDAYGHCGPVGAGHFVKMVHNGIEYGMMQAIAEGAAVLKETTNFNLDLPKIFKLYNQGSVIESRLVGWAVQAFAEDPELVQTSSKIDHSGEGEWTIQTAGEIGIAVPVINAAFQVRLNSTKDSASFRDKVVSALRGQFGGHKVTKKA